MFTHALQVVDKNDWYYYTGRITEKVSNRASFLSNVPAPLFTQTIPPYPVARALAAHNYRTPDINIIYILLNKNFYIEYYDENVVISKHKCIPNFTRVSISAIPLFCIKTGKYKIAITIFIMISYNSKLPEKQKRDFIIREDCFSWFYAKINSLHLIWNVQ